ncbi:uncharacterized protein LOC110674514 [Aedes aegypti]|uniref:Uncharacterized protein n=1 Tax=Aedes aegypti TaxID=7159 RepID=A0A6I8U7H3_AEDAE|nr:uncharacterized protein LOC110674514 [Aedes aegypti]
MHHNHLILFITVDSVKSRWKSLRDKFVREQNELSQITTSGSAAPEKAKWKFFDELLFLKGHCQRRPTASNYRNTESSQLAEKEADNYATNDPFIPEMAPVNDENFDEPEQLDTPTTRKRVKMDSRFNEMLDKVESLCSSGPAAPSRHESFAKYLCDRLEIFPLPVARSLEIEILSRVHNVIDEFEEMEIIDNPKL